MYVYKVYHSRDVNKTLSDAAGICGDDNYQNFGDCMRSVWLLEVHMDEYEGPFRTGTKSALSIGHSRVPSSTPQSHNIIIL